MLDKPSQIMIGVDALPAPLLMLPGTLCDERVFGPVLKRLGSTAMVPQMAGADTTAAMARAILERAPARFSLCGFSLGAIVALEVVHQAPDRVERLALIACNPGQLDSVAAAARAGLSQRGFVAGIDNPVIAAMAQDTPAQVYAEQTAMTLGRADSSARLHKIAVPTLLLCGTEDRTCTPQMSRSIAAAIPQARLTVVPGAGHYLPLERPDLVAAELAAWLAMPLHHDAKEPS